jgi:carboxyl-terminal processing protease
VVANLDQEHSPSAIGYIRLSQFSANATEEVAQAIKKLQKQGAESYILDLRNNPGGLLQAGIDIARLWLPDGTVVYTVNRQGIQDSFTATGEALTDAPLAVLVNPGTASASEILAGALQDNGRALLVGEKTFGKGLIQSLFELSDGSGLAVTVAKYETPNHKDIHKLGIIPDELSANWDRSGFTIPSGSSGVNQSFCVGSFCALVFSILLLLIHQRVLNHDCKHPISYPL